jgi:hypothetical protein
VIREADSQLVNVGIWVAKHEECARASKLEKLQPCFNGSLALSRPSTSPSSLSGSPSFRRVVVGLEDPCPQWGAKQ